MLLLQSQGNHVAPRLSWVEESARLARIQTRQDVSCPISDAAALGLQCSDRKCRFKEKLASRLVIASRVFPAVLLQTV